MKKNIFLFLFFLSLSSCLVDNIFPPLIITGVVTNVDAEGAVFHAKITDIGQQNVVEFGFVWDTIRTPKLETAEKYSFQDRACVGNFETKVSANLIAKRTYYVRAFIRNASITTYGEEISFVSQGGKSPEITAFSPHTANLNDTLLIVGRNFSSRNSMVKINQVNARVIKASQDSIWAFVPPGLRRKTSIISVATFTGTAYSKDSFTLNSAYITTFSPQMATYGDEIIVKGKNFLKSPTTLYVSFGTQNTFVKVVDDETLKVLVPPVLNGSSCSFGVVMNNIPTVSSEIFSLMPVEVASLSQKIILTGETFTITGKNFSPTMSDNRVYVGGVLAKTIVATKNTLQVTLPLQDIAVYESRNATVKVEVNGNTSVCADKLLINDKWFRRANAPVELGSATPVCSTCSSYNYQDANSFVVGKTAYIGLNSRKDFYAYDTETDTWRRVADFPGAVRFCGTGFVSGTKIYFGIGSNDLYLSQTSHSMNDWWEYDTVTDKWTQKLNFTGGGNTTLIGYSVSSVSYLSSGFTWEQSTGYGAVYWKYNVGSDTWTKETLDINKLKPHGTYWGMAKSVNDEVYIGFGDDGYGNFNTFYIYNPKTSQFTSITKYPYAITGDRPVCMTLNNTIYIMAGSAANFYYYDRSTNTWKYTQTNIYNGIGHGVGFEVGNIGFVGLGSSNRMYEFDPNR